MRASSTRVVSRSSRLVVERGPNLITPDNASPFLAHPKRLLLLLLLLLPVIAPPPSVQIAPTSSQEEEKETFIHNAVCSVRLSVK